MKYEKKEEDLISREYRCPVCGNKFTLPVYANVEEYPFFTHQKNGRRAICSFRCYRHYNHYRIMKKEKVSYLDIMWLRNNHFAEGAKAAEAKIRKEDGWLLEYEQYE